MRLVLSLLSSFWRDGLVPWQLLLSGHKWLPSTPVSLLDCQMGASDCGF